MASAERTATTVWEGDLAHGNGTLSLTSGATGELPVTWASRTEDHNGRTSPEELIAAAHAACFSMAFSSQLAKNSTPATKLSVKVTITFDKREAGWAIARSDIAVQGEVPGIDEATFTRLAEAAKEGCPVSGALKGNVELAVDAKLV